MGREAFDGKGPREGRAMNILLVDDSETDIRITMRAFMKSKIKNRIFTVTNGQAALDFLNNEGNYTNAEEYPKPDIILLDIKMPGMDGFQVLESVKKNLELSSIPIIMLTSSKAEEDVARSFKYGASSFIQKPVDFDEFVKLVEKFNYYWYIINQLPDRDL